MRLEQVVKEPEPLVGYIRPIKPVRSFSEKTQYNLTLFQGLILGGILGIAIVVFINQILVWINSDQTSKSFFDVVKTPYDFLIFGFVLLIIGLLYWLSSFLFNKIMNGLDKKIESYRLGEEGEEKIVQLILQTLDGRWNLFQNISLPGQK